MCKECCIPLLPRAAARGDPGARGGHREQGQGGAK